MKARPDSLGRQSECATSRLDIPLGLYGDRGTATGARPQQKKKKTKKKTGKTNKQANGRVHKGPGPRPGWATKLCPERKKYVEYLRLYRRRKARAREQDARGSEKV